MHYKKTMKFKLYIVNFIVFLYVNFYFCSAFILFMKNIDNIENIIMNKSKIAHIPITWLDVNSNASKNFSSIGIFDFKSLIFPIYPNKSIPHLLIVNLDTFSSVSPNSNNCPENINWTIRINGKLLFAISLLGHNEDIKSPITSALNIIKNIL